MHIVLLLLIIIGLALYATYTKARAELFEAIVVNRDINPNTVYSAAVITTTQPNTITSPTRLSLNRSTAQSNATSDAQQVTLDDTLNVRMMGFEYKPESANTARILNLLQNTLTHAQRAGCQVSQLVFAQQKDAIIAGLRAQGNVTCAQVQAMVMQQVEARTQNMPMASQIKLSVTELWDTVALEVCDKQTGLVDIDALDKFMTSLYKSFCPNA